MRRITTIAATAITASLIGYVGFGIHHLVSRDIQMKHSDVQLEVKSAEYKQLELQYKTLNSKLQSELQKNQTDDAAVKQLQHEKQLLDQKNQELQQQAQAKAAEKRRIADAANRAVNAVTGTATSYADGNTAKAYIYAHESGNNPGAINAGSGACGLGQALPCSKLPCSLSDYACQDNYFTSYAMARYGSWEAAYSFWLANHWW